MSRPHNWESVEHEAGPIGSYTVFECHQCGACGGMSDLPGRPRAFLPSWGGGNGPLDLDNLDCDHAAEQIRQTGVIQKHCTCWVCQPATS